MNQLLLLVIVWTSPFMFRPLWATPSKERFCSEAALFGGVRSRAFVEENHLAFKNYGGILDLGLCWWHALFQRASFYLVRFEPSLPKPTASEVKRLVTKIISGKEVVVINGYSTMKEFSDQNEKIIHAQLEDWQRRDLYLNGDWAQGLSGETSTTPADLRAKVEAIYRKVESEDEVVFSVMQIPGIPTHGIIFVAAEPTPEGIDLWLVDNNRPGEVVRLPYKYGDVRLNFYGGSVPYVFHEGALPKFRLAHRNHCK